MFVKGGFLVVLVKLRGYGKRGFIGGYALLKGRAIGEGRKVGGDMGCCGDGNGGGGAEARENGGSREELGEEVWTGRREKMEGSGCVTA